MRGEVVCRIIEMNVKVASDEGWQQREREEGIEVLKKNTVEMMKEVGRCYRQVFWREEVGGLWKMIERKRNLDVRSVAV